MYDVGQIVLMIVVTLLVFTGLVVAHEFGHYIVAKKRGIKVIEFAIGFGPKIVKIAQKGETEFTLRALPLGGYCKFADDVEKEPEEGDFRQASLKSRVLTILAGPVMNIIVAIVLTAILVMNIGGITAVVANVVPGSPAEEAGIRAGDTIKSMDGVPLDLQLDMMDLETKLATKEKGETMPLTIERDGQQIKLDVPYRMDADGVERIGITPGMVGRPLNFFEAVGLSARWIVLKIQETLGVIGGAVFMGQGTQNMAGAVGAAVMIGSAAQAGYETMLLIVALISVSLAVFNLLPLPALDGGKLVLYLVEKVRKKPVSENVEGILNLIGFGLLITLAVFLVFQDVGRFF